MALPDFGLMTKADKLKLDGIDTTTLLTKTEAASTYATKDEMREYIKQVVESDTGFVFINGNDSEVGLIPVFAKKDPQLSASNTDMGSQDSVDVEISRLGDGTISVSNVTPGDSSYSPSVTVNGTTINVARWSSADDSLEMTVSVAETDEYKAASITVTVTQLHISAAPGPPV